LSAVRETELSVIWTVFLVKLICFFGLKMIIWK